jgi:acetylornithine/N-succinyldiaminopimelate aminotransferase
MQAAALQDPVDPRALQGKIRDLGVLLTVAGGGVAGGKALRFTPPLIISDEQVTEGLATVGQALASL